MEKQLPKGWALSSLDVLVTKMANGANATQFEETVGYPISRIETIWNGDIDPTRVKYIKENDPAFFDKYRLQEGDILFSHINSDNHIGKTAIYKKLPRVLIHGINLLLLRFSGQVSSSFFNYQLKYMKNLGAFSAVAQRAVNQSSINQTKLKSFELLLPPFCEQKRIVAKIEELFSELDKGIESLTTAREQLKVYRQAVLKHAFEGKLTEQWRKDNADKLETPEQLLARIQQERETRYQQQLEKWKVAVKAWEANGKEGKKPGKPRENKYDIELGKEEEKDLPKLPNSWMWVALNELISGLPRAMQSGPFGSNLKHSEFSSVGKLVIGIDNVKDGYFTIGSGNRISDAKFAELEKYEARPGDLLVTVMASLGRTCVVPRDIEQAIITKHVYRISMEQHLLYPEFYNYLLQSHTVSRLRMFENAQGQTRLGLNSTILKELPVPLCQLEEQKLIVDYIEEKLNSITNFDNEIDNALKRAETLRQSILKTAFSGQLVPQDPNDEPASELLARIQAEKAASDVKAKKTPAKRGRKAKEASE